MNITSISQANGKDAVNIAGWVIFSITGNIYSEKQEDR